MLEPNILTNSLVSFKRYSLWLLFIFLVSYNKLIHYILSIIRFKVIIKKMLIKKTVLKF